MIGCRRWTEEHMQIIEYLKKLLRLPLDGSVA